MRLTAATLVILPLASGCSQPAVDFLRPRESVEVWPKPPDVPRVQFLGELKGSADIRGPKSFSESFNELLFGPQLSRRLVSPQAVAVHADGKRIAVADTNAGCVHVFDLGTRRYTAFSAAGDPSQALECAVAVCWVGDVLWVADAKRNAIAMLNGPGHGRWIGADVLKRPAGMTYCPSNELCYVSDAGAHAIVAFDDRGTLAFQFGSRGTAAGQFSYPSHLACGPDGTLVVADSLNFRVQRFRLDGSPLSVFGRKGDAAGDLSLPKGVAVGPEGAIWVVDANFENVQAFTPEGQLLLAFGEEGQGPGQFWLPAGICIDGQRRLWVADTYNRRVQVFRLLAVTTAHAG